MSHNNIVMSDSNMNHDQISSVFHQIDAKVEATNNNYNNMRRQIDGMLGPLLQAQNCLKVFMNQSKSLGDNLKKSEKNFDEWKKNTFIEHHKKIDHTIKSLVLFCLSFCARIIKCFVYFLTELPSACINIVN